MRTEIVYRVFGNWRTKRAIFHYEIRSLNQSAMYICINYTHFALLIISQRILIRFACI